MPKVATVVVLEQKELEDAVIAAARTLGKVTQVGANHIIFAVQDGRVIGDTVSFGSKVEMPPGVPELPPGE